MTTLVPLRVTAHLAGGLAHAGPWGIALDGLLASRIREQYKATAGDRGQVMPALLEQHDPEDLDLPLARCGTGPTWHWAATTSWPVDGHSLMPDVRWWSSRVDHPDLELLVGRLPAVIADRQGRYRARWMPLLTTVCSAVTWHAVGDPDQILAMLEGIPAIGKKRAAGHGQVTSWQVTPTAALDPWRASHLHPDGSLGRPTPPQCLTGQRVRDAGIGTAGLRPPYMHPSRQHRLHLPTAGPA
jgi:hypothetical protein